MQRIMPGVGALILLLCGVSWISAGTPVGPLTLRDGRQLREFVVAEDELFVRNRDGGWKLESVPLGQIDAARGRLAGNSREIGLVLYPSGAERDLGTRRVLARTVVVQTQLGIDPHGLPRTVEGGRRLDIPSYSRRLAVYEADDVFGAIDLANTLRAIPGIAQADAELGRHQDLQYLPNDKYFKLQWHLHAVEDLNGGTDGIDVGAVPAWDNYRGAGIIAGIVDDGIEPTHPDLVLNMRNDLGHDYLDGDSNPSPRSATNGHATCVAGLLAATGDNSLGVTGVAFQANLVSLRLIDGGTLTDTKIAGALSHRNDVIQIKNNSWGPPKAYQDLDDHAAPPFDAITDGVNNGRNGHGTIFIFSAGNFGAEGDNVNYGLLRNQPEVIPVGAISIFGTKAGYSTPGAPLLICAPGGDLGSRTSGILTTDRVGSNGFNTKTADEHGFDFNYTQFFNGTSASAPIAGGVIALILQANPNLGWRDVQEILIRTATKNSRTDPDWATNGAGFSFNHSFGAGLAHAGRATALAKNWQNLAPQTRRSRQEANSSIPIPDNSTNGMIREFAFSGDPIRVEHVLVSVNIAHPSRGQLAVTLISPSGMVSRLAEKHADTNPDYPFWTFSSRRHWGELSTGTWKVKIADVVSGKTGTLKDCRVELLGASQNTLTFLGNTLQELAGASNGNGGADPGETLAETIALQNVTGSDLIGINCTFSSPTPGVTLLTSAALYSTLSPGNIGTVDLRYRLSKTIPCGTPIQFTQYGVVGTLQFTNFFTRIVGAALSTVLTTHLSEGHELIPLAIPDLTIDQATNRINLGGNPVIESVQIALRIDHPTVGDCEITLIHPDQTEVALCIHRGGDKPNLGTGICGQGEVRTVFDDDATRSLIGGSAPFEGSFRPEEPLGVLRGKSANGPWVIRIADTFGGDSGILRCWSLTTVTRTPSTICTVYNLAPTVTNIALTIPHDTTGQGTLLGADTDGDPLHFGLTTLPSHGKVVLSNLADFAYTPAINFNGTDSFTYRANDGFADSAPATVSITVTAPILPPSFHLGPISVTPDGRFQIHYEPVGIATINLETSVDLKAWTPVTAFNPGGLVDYVETAAPTGTRFYRLR